MSTAQRPAAAWRSFILHTGASGASMWGSAPAVGTPGLRDGTRLMSGSTTGGQILCLGCPQRSADFPAQWAQPDEGDPGEREWEIHTLN